MQCPARTPRTGAPILKLIDFGQSNTHADAQGYVVGTPGYMAPEVEEYATLGERWVGGGHNYLFYNRRVNQLCP